ncbi:hypothetical protein MBLNU457_g0945t1 [Dothideomycetes sp. NU457]
MTSPKYVDSSAHSLSIDEYDYLDDIDDETTLPFPAALSRSAFLAPDFSPQSYLSTLRNRHQTLEDLRSDLRSRVQDLSKELFDLVNSEYEDFLTVGSTLAGGEDRVEEVRVGVLGFRREVEGIRDKVRERAGEVKEFLDERKEVRTDVGLGRRLLDVDAKLAELEGRLGVDDAEEYDLEDEEEEDEVDGDDEDGMGVMVTRLRKHALLFLLCQRAMDRIGQHPFLTAQKGRVDKIKSTLMLDLNAALRQAKAKGKDSSGSLLQIVSLYRELGEVNEAMKILKTR